MRKNNASPSGLFNLRRRASFLLCAIGVFLLTISFSASPIRGSANFADASFGPTGSMTSPRLAHTATLLGNGEVLITGGIGPVPAATTGELFNPTTGTFMSLASTPMNAARNSHTATLLPSGKVLITGGYGTDGSSGDTAELFDPASGTFTSLPPMKSSRYLHTATLLADGKILLAGGLDFNGGFTSTDTAEVFDPATATFTLLSNTMNSAFFAHTATLLPSGKVLIAGGYTTGATTTNTAELFDPVSGTFMALPAMTSPRSRHTATLLASGKVLLAGGDPGGNTTTNTAELFDPASGTFTSLLPMTIARRLHTATLLPSGKVLLATGITGVGLTNTAELFDPDAAMFSLVPSTLASARHTLTATLLPSGRVLLAGGSTGTLPTNSAELFDPASGTFTSLSNTMTSTRANNTATLLPSGKILIAGGLTSSFVATNRGELFDSTSGAFTSLSPNTMTSSRASHTATLLANGKVLIAGGVRGFGSTDYLNTSELFDPGSVLFEPLPAMSASRAAHTATLLPSGKVLLAGGYDGSAVTNAAELFDPASGIFTALPQMTAARLGHKATLLPTGKVLITGGKTPGVTNSAELFDPVTGSFTSLAPNTMASVRDSHTAILLPNGKVLIAGGNIGTLRATNTAELFDPATGAFTSLPPMTSSRFNHTATLLLSGKVVLPGGYTTIEIPGGSYRTTITNTAELFDPATGTFASLPPMNSERQGHTGTLLPTGKVIIAGGMTDNGATDMAEIFDEGFGFSDARRPVLSTVSNPLGQPASLVVAGTGFRGDSEASGGSASNSATNYPLLQLQRVDNEQSFFVPSDPATNWSDTSFTSETLGATNPLPSGHYRVTVFTNAIPSLPKIISIETPSPVQLAGVVSRKVHGTAGTFDIDLPQTGAPGIECRTGGAAGNYRIIVSFPKTVSCNNAQVTGGTGTVSSFNVNGSGTKVTVNLTGVGNAQTITVTLIGVNDGNNTGDVAVRMGVLLGDTTANGAVNSSDIAQTKSKSGQTVTSANFRQDVTINGSVNSSDISLVKSKSGTALP